MPSDEHAQPNPTATSANAILRFRLFATREGTPAKSDGIAHVDAWWQATLVQNHYNPTQNATFHSAGEKLTPVEWHVRE